MPVEPAAIFKRYEALKADRAPWESDWRDLANYILPRKGSAIGKTPVQGEKQTTRLFDSTAVDANAKLAQSIQGSLTSPAMRWFRLRMREEDLNTVPEIAMWLEDTANRAYSALQQSNWNAEVFEVYLDLGAFGTGAMLAVERDDLPLATFRGMRFEALGIGTYCIAEDAMGRVDTLYRVYSLSAAACVRQWGAAKVGERIRKLALTKPTERVEILHGVYPRPNGQAGAIATRKAFASCYLAIADKHLIHESGFDEFPFLVPRWTKASGEVYGRGPGHVALPDIRTLNKMTELESRAVAKAIDPPMLVRDHGVIGAIRLTPGAVTTTRDDPSKTFMPLESGAKYQVGQIKSEQLKMAIRDMYYNSQLQFPNNQVMTATEVERRYEIMHRVLGPTVGRLEYEKTIPAAERTVTIMFRRGALAPPPPQMIEAIQSGLGEIDILAEGPLARAQRGSDVLAAERWLSMILPLMQADPSVTDNVNFDQVARMTADATGVPAKMLRTLEEMAALRKDRNQKQAQAEQMAQMSEMSKAARNVAPALKAVAPAGMTQMPGQPTPAPGAAPANGQPMAA